MSKVFTLGDVVASLASGMRQPERRGLSALEMQAREAIFRAVGAATSRLLERGGSVRIVWHTGLYTAFVSSSGPGPDEVPLCDVYFAPSSVGVTAVVVSWVV